MSLAKYQQKRDFKRTSEPKGSPVRAGKALRFVVQKHDASRLHYDFRLELDGVLKSWAVPKGPSLDPARKALAVQVEDHPVQYGDFEGVIPAGEYGGGTVLLWDTGTWEPMHDPRAGFKSGKLHFKLHGEKLNGEWSLVRMHGKAGDEDGKNWLLMKIQDEFASKRDDVTKDKPLSVKSKRGIEQIADQRDDVWSRDAKVAAKMPGARKASFPNKLSPQLAVLAEQPPEGDQWLHEIKFDGYRLLAFIKSGKVTLITRNGNDWTAKFPGVARAIAKIKADSAIVDGEVVVLDEKGRSDFQSLQAMLKGKEKVSPVYYAFDLPFCDGSDLTQTPLVDRKERLDKLLQQSKLSDTIRYSEHFKTAGDEVLDKACSLALEGIISKRADAPYVSRRDPSWIKSKCDQRQEFIIIGYTQPAGSRSHFGALLLGYHNDAKKLVYAGRVGTGFDERLLKDIHVQLKKLEVKKPPTDVAPPRREQKDATWVQPKLVAEVRFTGWTRDGMLRHPTFIALRSDKPASQIVREVAITPKAIKRSESTAPKAATTSKTKPGKAKAAKATPAEATTGDSTIAGVTLSHPDKVLYPDKDRAKQEQVTKQKVAAYYESAQEWMLPHVVNRPLALVRCPAGLASKCFFQRNWSETLPPAVNKVEVGDRKKKETHIGVHDLAGIISLVQISVLEIHTWNCIAGDIEHPDQLVFDLDPGPDVSWKRVIESARILNRTLDGVGLPQFLKTSGGKGLHITVPIEPNIDWDTAKSFCETIVKSLASTSTLFVANMRKDLRGGKVYIDYHRNGRGATAVAPYSTRARAGAPVSMPISWEELGKLSSAAHFTVDTAGQYLERRKTDPWRDFGKSRIDLQKIARGKSAA